MPNGIYLADIVVRVYEDHTHDKRLAARLTARRILRKPGMNLYNAERDVLERVQSGKLADASPEVKFCPTFFVTVRGERHLLDGLKDEDRADMPLNSFQAKFFRELGLVNKRLSKRRAQRYLWLGGTLDAFVMDTPLWDYVRERVSRQLRVDEAEPRLLMFVRRAAEDRSLPLDPVANELTRLDRESFTDELLRDICRLYPVQAVDLKLDKLTEEPIARQSLTSVPRKTERREGARNGEQQQPPARHSPQVTEESVAGEPQSAELPWDEKREGFVTGKEGVKLSDDKLSLSGLSKLCQPSGSMRYMRKQGVGLRVHLVDLRQYLESTHPQDGFDQIDEYVAGVEERKAQARKTKEAGHC